jgi:hypothetical protein
MYTCVCVKEVGRRKEGSRKERRKRGKEEVSE